MDQNRLEVNEMYRVECQNRDQYYSKIQAVKGTTNIEEYK